MIVLILILFLPSAGLAEDTTPAGINASDQDHILTNTSGYGETMAIENATTGQATGPTGNSGTGNESPLTGEEVNGTEIPPGSGSTGSNDLPNQSDGNSLSWFTGTESLLSTATWETDEQYPAIWEDRVVWASSGPSPEDPELYDSVIYMYNVTSGNSTKIDSSWPWATHPDIWGDFIVWQEYDLEEYDLEIALYTISTAEKVLLTHDTLNQLYPDIWGDFIVWQEGDETFDQEFGVYLYSIDTGITTKLSENTPFALHPAIWEDRVVWEDGRNGNDLDIFLFNVTEGSEQQVTFDPGFQVRPSIWDNLIVWEDQRDIPQIFLYNITTGNETRISEGYYYHQNPRISGRYVVYENEMTYYDISLLDTVTLQDEIISQDTTGAAQLEPDIWGERIVWTDGRDSNYDVYLYTLDVSQEPLHADFTTNTTQGPAPLTIAFTDTTSGQAEGWSWDFGDGASSGNQDPVHTYETGGSYTVTLTVHNPRQRDAIRKVDLISAGAKPVPRFSAELTSGPAPLAVAFLDESSGNPTAWHWNFGDGTISEEQNPLHIFDRPGVYDLELIVSNIFGNASILKQELITVMNGTYFTCRMPSEGIEVQDAGLLTLNTTLAGSCSLYDEAGVSTLRCIPDEQSGIALIIFHALNGTGFVPAGNDTITGTISGATINSCDLGPLTTSQEAGDQCFMNFTFSVDQYDPGAVIQAVSWEGSTPDDLIRFHDTAMRYNACLDHIAYSVRLEGDTGSPGPATLIFGIHPDWIEHFGWRWCEQIESEPTGAAVSIDSQFIGSTPICISGNLSPGNHTVRLAKPGFYDSVRTIALDDKRDSIRIIRIGDDGNGQVLDTTFIGHDTERNLDLFQAESPDGLCTFGLAALSKSGNVFQIVNLVASRVASSGGGGGGSSSSGMSSSAAASLASIQETATHTSESVSTMTPAPEQPSAPEVTVQNDGSAAAQPDISSPSGTQDTAPIESLVEGTSTLVLLKNISVIFVVIFVSVVFYLRWKEREK